MSLDQEYMELVLDQNQEPIHAKFHYKDNFNFGYDVVDEIAKRHPEKRAMVYQDIHGNVKEFTFKDISEQSNVAANILKAKGVKKGDYVMLLMKRRYQYWFLVVACHKLGAIAIPTSHMVTGEDIAERVDKASIKAVICAADKHVCQSVIEAKKYAKTEFLTFTGDFPYEGLDYFWEMEGQVEKNLDRVDTKVEDPMLLYFTSGTTGSPKGVLHNYSYPLAHIMTAKYWHGCIDGGLHFTIADTGWAKSAWGKLYGQWFCECAIVVYDYDTFIAHEILDILQKFKVTSFCAPPTIYNYLLRVQVENYDLSSVREYVTAGEAMPKEIAKEFRRRVGIQIREGFGQTETTLITANFTFTKGIREGVGFASPLYDLLLVDSKDQEVKRGEVGELVIRPTKENQIPLGIFYNYFQDEERYKEIWKNGLYHTKDKMYQDEDGSYHFTSRNDDVIKSSGYRIGPSEVEDIVHRHPAVGEVAVTGYPDPTRGQLIKATIVLKEGFTGDRKLVNEIRNFVKSQVASYKIPRMIEFVEEIPKTTSGKINRVAIRQMDLEKLEQNR